MCATHRLGVAAPGGEDVLTRDALDFVLRMHRGFNSRPLSLLDRGMRFSRNSMTAHYCGSDAHRNSSVLRPAGRPGPSDLMDRRCEITGAVDCNMMSNA